MFKWSERPNLDKISNNLADIGMPPEMAKTVMWAGSGHPGQADYVKDMVGKIRLRRFGRRAKYQLRNLNERNAELLYGEYLEEKLAETRLAHETEKKELRLAIGRLNKRVNKLEGTKPRRSRLLKTKETKT